MHNNESQPGKVDKSDKPVIITREMIEGATAGVLEDHEREEDIVFPDGKGGWKKPSNEEN